MSKAKQAIEITNLQQAIEYRDRYFKLDLYFSEKDQVSTIDGKKYHSRHKYPKAMEFFNKGATHRQRLMLAANRSGKTIAAAFELSCHMTGSYP